MTEQDANCPYLPSFLNEVSYIEGDRTMRWLKTLLDRIGEMDEICPEDAAHARRATVIIDGLFEMLPRLHDTCHERDDTVRELERVVESLRWVIEGDRRDVAK